MSWVLERGPFVVMIDSGTESSSVCVSSHNMESVSVLVSATVDAGDDGSVVWVLRAWDREGDEKDSVIIEVVGVCSVTGLRDNLASLGGGGEGDLF